MKSENHKPAPTPEDVLNELRSLLAEAEKLFGEATADNRDGVAEELRRRFAAAQEKVTDLADEARRKVTDGLKTADQTVRDNPYQSLAIALGIGLLLGALLGRRSK